MWHVASWRRRSPPFARHYIGMMAVQRVAYRQQPNLNVYIYNIHVFGFDWVLLLAVNLTQTLPLHLGLGWVVKTHVELS